MMRSPGRRVPSRIERRMARSASSLLDTTSGALKMSVGSITRALHAIACRAVSYAARGWGQPRPRPMHRVTHSTVTASPEPRAPWRAHAGSDVRVAVLWVLAIVPQAFGFWLVAGDVAGVAADQRRTFLLAGLLTLALATLAQVAFGYRLALYEGPAAGYLASVIVVAARRPRPGGDHRRHARRRASRSSLLGLARFDRLLLPCLHAAHGDGVRPRRHRRRDADHAGARGRRRRRHAARDEHRMDRGRRDARRRARAPAPPCAAPVRAARRAAGGDGGRVPDLRAAARRSQRRHRGAAAAAVGSPGVRSRRRAPVHHRRAASSPSTRSRRSRSRPTRRQRRRARAGRRAPSRSTAGRRSEARCSATSSGPSAGSTRCRSPGCSAPIGARRSRSRRS